MPEWIWLFAGGGGDEPEVSEKLEQMEPGGEDFCGLFGADKLVKGVRHFVASFVSDRVLRPEEMRREVEAMMADLLEGLAGEGHVPEERPREKVREIRGLTEELTVADQAAALLEEYREDEKQGMETREEGFLVKAVEPGILRVKPFLEKGEIIELGVSEKASDLCREGWQVHLEVGGDEKEWEILWSGWI